MKTLRAINNFNLISLNETPSLRNSILAKTVEKVSHQLSYTELKEPSKASINEVYILLSKLYKEGNGLSFFPSKFLSISPWAIFTEFEDGQEELIARPNFLDQYIELLLERKPRAVLPPLLHVFLLYYPFDSPLFEKLRLGIISLFSSISSLRVDRLRDQVTSSGIINKNAHSLLVEDLIERNQISSTLVRFNLSGTLECGGFSQFVLEHYLSYLRDHLSSMSEEVQYNVTGDLIEFFSDDDGLHFPKLKTLLVNCILEGYSYKSASKRIQEQLKDFFITHYGDPRLSPSRWLGASEAALITIRKWLVEETLDHFFTILSHVAATDPTADKHWKYRKRFWQAYLRNGVISEAWVALGPEARAEAPAILGEKSSNYASLLGANKKHSSLIIKIDDVVITEWSHSGSYRLWRDSNNPPDLYRTVYKKWDLMRKPDITGTHHSSRRGGWQKKLSNIIQDNTGLSISRDEYMYD